MYALVRYYTVIAGIATFGYMDRKMMVPRIKSRDPCLASTYGCLEVSNISAHAHVVPDFDEATDGHDTRYYVWDLLL